MRTVALTKESTKDILENLLKRSPNNYGKFEAAVDEILNKVKTEGDAALFAYTKEFDKTEISADTIKVTEEEIKEAYEAVDPALIDVIRKALVNIRSYHEKQRQNSWFTSETNGTMLGQKVTALERVGVYVPGGKAVYPSSVLMNIVPAKVAGVDQIVMTTPPGKDGKVNPSTLVAAKEAGADEIYKETWLWLKNRGCEKLVNKRLLESYSQAFARFIQCEEALSSYGLLGKHPTTGGVIASPFVQMSQTFQKQANLLWYEIFDIVKQNCTTKFDGSPQDDLMEQLLSSRK